MITPKTKEIIIADKDDIKKATPTKKVSMPKQIGFLENLKGPEEMSTSGVPSGIKVVFIFLINLKLTKTKEIPEMIRIKPNKELRSIGIGKENKRIICNTKLANKMIGGKVIFIN